MDERTVVDADSWFGSYSQGLDMRCVLFFFGSPGVEMQVRLLTPYCSFVALSCEVDASNVEPCTYTSWCCGAGVFA